MGAGEGKMATKRMLWYTPESELEVCSALQKTRLKQQEIYLCEIQPLRIEPMSYPDLTYIILKNILLNTVRIIISHYYIIGPLCCIPMTTKESLVTEHNV